MNLPTPSAPARWRTPEALVQIGFTRSRVVMMNEAHNMFLRSIRTREVGRRVLPAAHDAGVRHIAMEALFPDVAATVNEERTLPDVEDGYLSQPEMRTMIEAALALGWTLVPYEADLNAQPSDLTGWAATNWREEQQARNLVAALSKLPDDAPLFVWCGNGHHLKTALDEWQPMGVRFRELSDIDPFAIDQNRSVEFDDRVLSATRWVAAYADELAERGGAAGFLSDEAPSDWTALDHADAFVIANDNAMT